MDGYLAIPQEGADRTAKIFSGLAALTETKFVARSAINLYRDAYIAIDTVGADDSYKNRIIEGATDIFGRLFAAYDSLFDQSRTYIIWNIRAFDTRVADDDDRADNLYNPILNYNDLNAEVLDSTLAMSADFLQRVHSDTMEIPYKEKLDSIFAHKNWKTYNYLMNFARECSSKYVDMDKKALDEVNFMYETGAELYEELTANIVDYRMLYVDNAFALIDQYRIANEDGDKFIREMVKKDPATFGYLLDLSLEAITIPGDVRWKTAYLPGSGFQNLDYSDEDWSYAVNVVQKQPEPEIISVDSMGVDSVEVDTISSPIDSTLEETDPGEMPDSTLVEADSTVIDSMAVDSVLTDSLGVELAEEDTLAEPTVEEQEEELDLSALDVIVEQPIWADSLAERVYFRHKFTITGKPISATYYIAVDENYALFINGKFVAEGESGEDVWIKPYSSMIKGYLKEGENVIAIEAIDEDLTGHGLWFKLEYNLMPQNIDNLPVIRR
jgi:hypothetical protein